MHERLSHIDKAIRTTAATTVVLWNGANLRIE